MEKQKQTFIVVPCDKEFKHFIEIEAKNRRLSVAALIRTKMSFCVPKYQISDNCAQKNILSAKAEQ